MLMAYQLKHERLESDENSLWRCTKRNLRDAVEQCENDLLNFQLREIQFICSRGQQQEDKKLSTYTT